MSPLPPKTAPRVPRIFRWFGKLGLWMIGWKVDGQVPENQPKAIFIAAPHTTNWDGLVMVLVALAMGIRLSWLGKLALFKGPKGIIMRWAGAVPVDRSGKQDTVQQVGQRFAESDKMYLAVAPAGTRKWTDHWKTGFYHMAVHAQVPIFCGYLDYATGRGGVLAVVEPTGNIEEDMARFQQIYAEIQGGIPENKSTIGLRPPKAAPPANSSSAQ